MDLRAKPYHKQCHVEQRPMKKTVRVHERQTDREQFLLQREGQPPAQKKNPLSPQHTTLGVSTKGMVTEVKVRELGLLTQGRKFIWRKYAQVTNNPGNNMLK
ncbi:hypothetical protein A6R68_09900, partial [Neotoma lepida]